MNPRIFRIYEKAHSKKIEEQDQMNWMLGKYFYAASYSATGSLFFENFTSIYPEKPYLQEVEQRAGETEEERIERELQAYIQAEEAWIRNEQARGLPESL